MARLARPLAGLQWVSILLVLAQPALLAHEVADDNSHGISIAGFVLL